MKLVCAFCEEEFEGSRRTRRYCSESHRKAASKARRLKPPADEDAGADRTTSALVTATRRDLEKAGVLDTFQGQLAIQLARKLSLADGAGLTGLSKELRTVMAAALEGVVPPSDDSEPDQPPDELERVRRARENKARQASGRT